MTDDVTSLYVQFVWRRYHSLRRQNYYDTADPLVTCQRSKQTADPLVICQHSKEPADLLHFMTVDGRQPLRFFKSVGQNACGEKAGSL